MQGALRIVASDLHDAALVITADAGPVTEEIALSADLQLPEGLKVSSASVQRRKPPTTAHP